MNKKSLPKIAVLATGLVAAILAATTGAQFAQATPRASSCARCHGAATAGTTTATPSTATPAPGAAYTVAIALVANATGGNTGYGIVPVAPATESTSGGNTGALLSYTANMTAPAAAGTYSYTVWTDQGPTDGTARVGTAAYTITVGVAPTTTPPTTTPPTSTSPTSTPSTSTAPLPTSTAPSPTSTAPLPTSTAPSPTATIPADPTNFGLHGFHLAKLDGKGFSAPCAECHFRLHSAKNVGTQSPGTGLVSFAPNVTASGGKIEWTTTGTGGGSCTLTCHGVDHSSEAYSGAP